LGVAETARDIAEKINYKSSLKAEITGLLHDYAKSIPKEKLQTMAQNIDLPFEYSIDKYEINIPEVLHAPVGAYLINKHYNITDREIIEAVRYHTIGSPELTELGIIIFLADLIEPSRDFPQVDNLRKIIYNDLYEGLITACDHLIIYNIKQGKLLHHNTLLMRNAYLGG
ncbi:MAG: bis(5'-nucleosyl)-tetraphosphatase (symmetrical) YqeK, partial [Halanaerobiales bacterium]